MDVTWKRAQGHGCHLGDPILPDLKLGAVGLAGNGALVSQWPTAAGINGTSSMRGLDFPQDSPICFCFHSRIEDLRKVLSFFFLHFTFCVRSPSLQLASQVPGSLLSFKSIRKISIRKPHKSAAAWFQAGEVLK